MSESRRKKGGHAEGKYVIGASAFYEASFFRQRDGAINN